MPHTDATYTPYSTSTNQLVSASNAQTYALNVTYGDWGRIEEYGLQQTNLNNNITTNSLRKYNYGSLNEGQTVFAPNVVWDTNGTGINETYGINGSLQRRETQRPNSAPETELYHFTINGNMQAYIYDNLLYTYYGYDNANSRKYKISYQNSPTWINGQPMPTELHIRNMMFYPNSYLNFNNDGYYTKHYYNGMERIASRLGDQGFGMEQPTDGDLLSRKNDLGKVFVEQFQEMLGNQDSIKLHDTLQLRDLQPNPAGGLYYYHPNHLGSTCYVTDENASVVQGFLYAPFGEITNEYNSSFGSSVLPKYSFNAKELDEETGMYYYEARYMAPPVFISRDPLFEKYPTFSPYAYCANNPVRFIDPTGMEIWKPDEWGNLIAEDGDDAKSLSKCMGISYEEACALLTAQGYSTENVPEKSVLKLDNAFTRDLAEHGNLNTDDERLNYNCWGSSIYGVQGQEIQGIPYPIFFDNMLYCDFMNVDFSDCQLGKTIIRFETEYPYDNNPNEAYLVDNKFASKTSGEIGSASHGAVYYGTSNDGTVYVYSKNGYGVRPVICPIDVLYKPYGKVTGLFGQSGYYNPKITSK